MVRDETGYFAVFSEQGTSASLLAAATFLDAIARFPGNDGSDSDAIGAYTQVPLKELEDKQGIETKIHYHTLLPKHKMYHRHTIYPTAEKLARTSLSLPIDAWMTNKECKTVCDAIKEFFA